MSEIHELKTAQPYFEHVLTGVKPFEIRYNDRGFRPGDRLLLREVDAAKQYTGRSVERDVTYVLGGSEFGLTPPWVVLGLGGDPLIRRATADEIAAEIKRYRRQLEAESELPEVKKSGRWLAQVLLKIGVAKVCEDIARRVGGGGGGGQ